MDNDREVGDGKDDVSWAPAAGGAGSGGSPVLNTAVANVHRRGGAWRVAKHGQNLL